MDEKYCCTSGEIYFDYLGLAGILNTGVEGTVDVTVSTLKTILKQSYKIHHK